MQDDWFALLLFLAIGLLTLLRQTRGRPPSDAAHPSPSGAPPQQPVPPDNTQAAAHQARDRATDRTRRPLASRTPLLAQRPDVNRQQARPVRPRRSTFLATPASARQAVIALTVLGPCRARQPYTGEVDGKAPPP